MSIHIREVSNELIDELSKACLSLFRKDFFGIFHGSISARISQDRFVINKNEAIFDRICEENLILLDKIQDYRWNDASIDAHIHADIYANFSEAKFIIQATPPFCMAYALKNTFLEPKDYFGHEILGERISIFDTKDFESWYERADTDIVRYLKQSAREFVIIRGYGIFTFGRTLAQIAKTLALIELSCKILVLSQRLDLNLEDSTRFEI